MFLKDTKFTDVRGK